MVSDLSKSCDDKIRNATVRYRNSTEAVNRDPSRGRTQHDGRVRTNCDIY